MSGDMLGEGQVQRRDYPERIWDDVAKVRVARPTLTLASMTEFYIERVGLQRTIAFLGHDGFDGAIFNAGFKDTEWELTQGPAKQILQSDFKGGWALGWMDVADTLRDPDGFAAALCPVTGPSRRVVFSRRTARLAECRQFYGKLLGWPMAEAVDSDAGLISEIELPAAKGTLKLYSSNDALSPTGEDLLVLYFCNADRLVAAARYLREAGVPAMTPDNPWWKDRAICFADPDGFGLILANIESG
jgi:hypothetical protein